VVTLAVVVLAAAAGSAGIPRPQVMERFPDASYWPGVGSRQVANMLAEIQRDAWTAMRSEGPGPQQLAALWRSGRLKREDRVAVLLGGAAFHAPVMLPLYAEALRSSDLRERQAAAVGLFWLLGALPPDPQTLAAAPDAWRKLEGLAEALVAASRTRSLVGLWVDSYLQAIGVPARPGLRLIRGPDECLAAIREIAEPEDLNELLALWPLLRSDHDRFDVLRTLEIVTLSRLVAVQKGARASWGGWIYETGALMVDALVQRTCASVDGEGMLRANLMKLAGNDGCDGCTYVPWARTLRFEYPPTWVVALERLPAFGAPAVDFDRRELDSSKNQDLVEPVRQYFAITAERWAGKASVGPAVKRTPLPWEVPLPVNTPTTENRR
jgi:hypothetical protein